MSNAESVRMRALRQREGGAEPSSSGRFEAAAASGGEGVVDVVGAEEDVCGVSGGTGPVGRVEEGVGRLWREDGRVMYCPAGEGEAEAVRVLWARPLSGRGGPVSLMRAGKKREVAYIRALSLLDCASRAVAEEELAAGMVLPAIRVIYEVRPRFGNYYWDVETDMGRHRFLLSSPENNSFRFDGDCIVIRDVSGNCFEIPSIAALDAASRREFDRVL